MRMLMIGGSGPDETRLQALLQEAGLSVDVCGFPAAVHAVDASSGVASAWDARAALARAPVTAGPKHDAAAPAGDGSTPRALLFESPLGLDIALRALMIVRSSPSFDATVAIVCVDIDHSDGLERVRGFDDFMSLPWSAPEVWARIVAAEHRRAALEPDSVVQISGVWMDRRAREAQVDGRSVRLTAREFALFSYLCVRRGCVLSRSHLLEQVWGHGYGGGQRTVDVHIRRLRSKLGPALRIDTVRGGGYRLRVEAGATASPTDLAGAPANRTSAPGRSWPLAPLGSRSLGRRWPFSRCAPGY